MNNLEILKYKPKHKTVRSVQWDGTENMAIKIMEWVSAGGGNAYIQAYDINKPWECLKVNGSEVEPYDYIIKRGPVFEVLEETDFHDKYKVASEADNV